MVDRSLRLRVILWCTGLMLADGLIVYRIIARFPRFSAAIGDDFGVGIGEIRRQLGEWSRLATAVDQAIVAAVPAVEDLQVAVAGDGMVAISGIAPSADAQCRALIVAQGVDGVRQTIGGLTVV